MAIEVDNLIGNVIPQGAENQFIVYTNRLENFVSSLNSISVAKQSLDLSLLQLNLIVTMEKKTINKVLVEYSSIFKEFT